MAKRTVRLHLVGFTSDLKDLVLATRRGAQSGNYHLEADDRLRRALDEVGRLIEEGPPDTAPPEGEEPASGAVKDRSQSSLNPREIQSLLREGKSPEEVARLAGVDVAWIERFTGPILAERAGIIEQVRSGVLTRARLGASGATIGEAIDAQLEARRIQAGGAGADGWSAVRRAAGWHVYFDYSQRGQKRQAGFSFDPATRQVKALNDAAAQLAWQSPPPSAENPKPRSRGRSPAARKAGGRKPAKAARKPQARKPSKRR